MKRAYNFIDLTGKRFGKLIVLHQGAKAKDGATKWVCRCDCGNVKEIRGDRLRARKTKSCGCHAKTFLQDLHEKNKTHGMSNTRLYHIWNGMLKRCENSNCEAYKYYGGRGIKVCPEWHDLKIFADWAYSNGYDENAKRGECTIDRINVNGNYEPDNCRWADVKTQNNNKRKSKKAE